MIPQQQVNQQILPAYNNGIYKNSNSKILTRNKSFTFVRKPFYKLGLMIPEVPASVEAANATSSVSEASSVLFAKPLIALPSTTVTSQMSTDLSRSNIGKSTACLSSVGTHEARLPLSEKPGKCSDKERLLTDTDQTEKEVIIEQTANAIAEEKSGNSADDCRKSGKDDTNENTTHNDELDDHYEEDKTVKSAYAEEILLKTSPSTSKLSQNLELISKTTELSHNPGSIPATQIKSELPEECSKFLGRTEEKGSTLDLLTSEYTIQASGVELPQNQEREKQSRLLHTSQERCQYIYINNV